MSSMISSHHNFLAQICDYIKNCVHKTFSVAIPSMWWHGVVVNALVVINEVTLCRARLILGWVTVCGWVYHLSM